jgi:hypothetical protein
MQFEYCPGFPWCILGRQPVYSPSPTLEPFFIPQVPWFAVLLNNGGAVPGEQLLDLPGEMPLLP